MKVVLKQLDLMLLIGFIGLAASWANVFVPLSSFASPRGAMRPQSGRTPSAQNYPRVHSPAPNFTLPDVSGRQVHLSDFKNKWRNIPKAIQQTLRN